MKDIYTQFYDASLNKEVFPRSLGKEVLLNENIDVFKLALTAGDVRQKFFAKEVKVHQIHNIKSGYCPEDCHYCGQSQKSDADILKYPLKEEEAIIQDAKDAKKRGVYRYCMVSSGRGPSVERSEQLARIIKRIDSEVGIKTCLSCGLIDKEKAQLFKDAGLDRLNHNLNTSENHTANIVTTHTYQDRIATIKAAKEVGLENCSGMICGLGESHDDILDVAYELVAKNVSSIPINFLVPIKGNKLQNTNQLTPEYCIRILSLFRFVHPDKEIRIGGGREKHLANLQSLALYPANSLFIDGYLVTEGNEISQDMKLIQEAGFALALDKSEMKAGSLV